jgi:hypothetical protein
MNLPAVRRGAPMLELRYRGFEGARSRRTPPAPFEEELNESLGGFKLGDPGRSLRRVRAVTPFVAAIVVAALAARGAVPLIPALVSFVLLVAVAKAGLWWLEIQSTADAFARMRTEAGNDEVEDVDYDVAVTLADDGAVTRWAGQEVKLAWRDVERVHEFGGSVFLVAAKAWIQIPFSAFSDAQRRVELVSFARERIERARTTRPAGP